MMGTADLSDKILGMLLLGVYADALGAPHEARGLSGEGGDPETAHRLAPVGNYHPAGRSGDAWWVWADGDDLNADAVGVPTDDSSFRLAILQEWLCQGSGPRVLHEAAFLAWLEAEVESPPDPDAPSWQRRRFEQMRSWIAMMNDQSAWERAPETWKRNEENRFYRPGVPVVFGMFLYAELGALRSGCTCADVAAEFAGFCRLDEGYAGVGSGVVAAIVSEAVVAPPSEEGFGAWFLSRTDAIAGEVPNGPAAAVIRSALAEGRRIGTASRGLAGDGFVQRLGEEIYRPRLQRLDHGLANFDPAMFLAMMAGAVAWAEDDPLAALRVLARSPGDADTMPSFLGTIIGARLGAARLHEISPGLSEDLGAMRNTVEGLFGIDLAERAACLTQLSRRFGCLGEE